MSLLSPFFLPSSVACSAAAPVLRRRASVAGAALIIVLFFILLLTVVVMALLFRSTTNDVVSGNSAYFNRTDLYGRGAIDQVIGDLRQEIAAGSTVAAVFPSSGGTGTIASPHAVSTNSDGYTSSIYRPALATNAVPSLTGPSAYGSPSSAASIWNATFPNLVKESMHGVPFYPVASSYSPAPQPAAGRAAAVSTSSSSLAPGSASGLSRNGRAVSLARWNEALLLPKASATITRSSGGTTISDSSTDTTPNSSFVAPDWILTAADGTNPTAFNAAAMSNPRNTAYVVGRYAYAIYNEGGLLDANVAGSPGGYGGSGHVYPPSGLAATSSGNGPSEQAIWSRKGPASFADLTLLPGISSVSAITPAQVSDALVGWRNSATAEPSGSFPLYSFSSSGIDNFFASQLGLSNQFMNANAAGQSKADRAFTSRQQLISFLKDLVPASDGADQAYLQDTMMYLGTFSRSLNQPSYWPDPNRPMVFGPQATSATLTGYTGGNSAYQEDNIYNPPFKSLRVTQPFTRADGSTAIVGEPLVKKRFALSRLCWLTYLGPSAALSSSDPAIQQYLADGVPQQLLNEGTPANILAYFGLTWVPGPAGASSPGGYWVYNHNLNDLGTLDQVAVAAREPDFFELLQAAVHVGAIAKGSIFEGNGTGNFNYPVIEDSSVSVQIIQLGANIIDGANPTQYPTHIIYNIGSTSNPSYRNAYGAMDLPYLNGVTQLTYIVQPPNPPAPVTGSGTAIYTTPVASATPMASSVSQGLYSAAEGTGVTLQVPSVWNPYDVNGTSVAHSLVPTNLRIVLSSPLTTLDSVLSASGGAWPDASSTWNSGEGLGSFPTAVQPTYYYPSGVPPPPGAVSGSSVVNSRQFTNQWTSENSTEIDFSNVSSLYREPTCLLQTGIPAGSGVALGKNNAAPVINSSWNTGIPDYQTSSRPLGFFVTTFPLRWSVATNSTATGVPPYYVYTANFLNGTPPASGLTIRLEYQVNGTWIPYMEYFTQMLQYYHAYVPLQEPPYALTPNTGSSSTGSIWNQNFEANGFPGGNTPVDMIVYDPRSATWAFPVDEMPVRSFLDGSTTGPITDTVQTQMPTTSAATANHSHSNSNGQASNNTSYIGWFQGGFATFITTGFKQLNAWSSPSNPQIDFYADPDGTVRRAMAAYNGAGTGSGSSYLYKTSVGLPLVSTQGGAAPAHQSQSRPIVLHRPYRSVAELGYVFSNAPWKNVDFFTPESGYSALLDTFCINEDYQPDALSAGRVDLNGRQAPVFQALIAGAYRDEEALLSPAPGNTAAPLTVTEAAAIAQDLVTRTSVGGTNPNVATSGPQPLANVADLVGRWIPGTKSGTMAAPINGAASYDGLSADLNLYSGSTTSANNILQRFRESTMRALSDAGQAGTWNLLIDVIVQSGHYPINAAGLADFLVEGERRYWVHVAIDRSTGQVIDEKIEPVNE